MALRLSTAVAMAMALACNLGVAASHGGGGSHGSHSGGGSHAAHSSGAHPGGAHNVKGYTKKDGTVVAPHRDTNPDGTRKKTGPRRAM